MYHRSAFRWLVYGPCPSDQQSQVVPSNDEREHATVGRSCWCGPRVELVDPDTGVVYTHPLVIHHAADCRELVEEAEQILRRTEEEMR